MCPKKVPPLSNQASPCGPARRPGMPDLLRRPFAIQLFNTSLSADEFPMLQRGPCQPWCREVGLYTSVAAPSSTCNRRVFVNVTQHHFNRPGLATPFARYCAWLGPLTHPAGPAASCTRTLDRAPDAQHRILFHSSLTIWFARVQSTYCSSFPVRNWIDSWLRH